VGVVSSEDTYYIYVAAEAGGDRSRRDIHLNLLDICNYTDVLLNWVLLDDGSARVLHMRLHAFSCLHKQTSFVRVLVCLGSNHLLIATT